MQGPHNLKLHTNRRKFQQSTDSYRFQSSVDDGTLTSEGTECADKCKTDFQGRGDFGVWLPRQLSFLELGFVH